MNNKEKLWTKDFFLIWQGQLISTLGDASYNIALGFWILQVTGSTAMMGTLMAVSALPGILISPFAGVWIERLRKKYLLISMDLIRGFCMLYITYMAFHKTLAVWMVFAAGILLSICGVVFRPGVNTVIPEMVPKSKLSNANSILSIASTGSNMLGNITGGVLYQLLGAPFLFLLNGLSYFFSGSSMALIKQSKNKLNTHVKQKLSSDIKEGFRYMWSQKGLRYLLMMSAFLNFFSYIAIVLFLPFFKQTANLGSGRYGIAMACFMGGAMLGYIVMSTVNIQKQRRLRLFLGSNIISDISLVIAIVQHRFPVMILFILVGGFFNAIINVILISSIQSNTPSEFRGKVMAFTSMSTQCMTPFAMALGGLLAVFIPVKIIIAMSFTIIVLIAIIFTHEKHVIEFISSPM